MAGGDPSFGGFEHGGVEADVIFFELDVGAPPRFFEVVEEFDAVGAEVVEAGHAAVDVTPLINKTSSFAEADDVVDFLFHGVNFNIK